MNPNVRKNGLGNFLSPLNVTMSALYDISAADSEQVVLYAQQPISIYRAYLLWNEATGSDSAAGDITIGSSSGGAELVAATSYPTSKASGSVTNLTLKAAANNLAAGTSVFASHDQAANANGTYYLVLEWQFDDAVA